MNQPIILCVDDQTTILDSLGIELKDAFRSECMIELAESGEEALEIVREALENHQEIAVVISDYIMPNMKGDELLGRIHTLSPKTLNIMLSGQADLEAVGRAIERAKLYRYIAKPWHSKDLKLTLISAVNSYIQEQKIAEQNAKLERLNREQEILIEELYQINKVFDRFVPREFLKLLNKEKIVDVRLGDRGQREMSVLFADIREFTTISEGMTCQENFNFINSFLAYMEPAIIENHGFIDKYIGDGIMALFSGEADDAVKAGIAMLQNLAEFNEKRAKSGDLPIKIGIGIHTGSLMLGTIGGQSRIDSTAIGDTVNLASRLESLTKNYKTSLLISDETWYRLQNQQDYSMRFIDRVKVKGKSKSVAFFEVFDGDYELVKELKSATKLMFEQAVCLFHGGVYTKAEQLFKECLQINNSDRVAQVYLERFEHHLIKKNLQ
jgi:class 3 adenylate cyclase/CheY-like chemotaxis protein